MRATARAGRRRPGPSQVTTHAQSPGGFAAALRRSLALLAAAGPFAAVVAHAAAADGGIGFTSASVMVIAAAGAFVSGGLVLGWSWVRLRRARAAEDRARQRLEEEAESARRAAETAARAAFLGSVTHDLRSPINACVTWLDVLELQAAPAQGLEKRALEAIRRNLDLQARLLDDLMDAAQMEAGGIEIRPSRAELGGLIEPTLAGWRQVAAAKAVRLDYERDGDCEVEVDTGRVIQALDKLVDNALACTPAGGRILIELRHRVGWAEVSVTDTGAGLRPDEMLNMFRPFWRGTGARSKGLGLGLAIAEHLVERHRGSIHAHSGGPGQGATFTIRLPLRAASATGAAMHAAEGALQ